MSETLAAYVASQDELVKEAVSVATSSLVSAAEESQGSGPAAPVHAVHIRAGTG